MIKRNVKRRQKKLSLFVVLIAMPSGLHRAKRYLIRNTTILKKKKSKKEKHQLIKLMLNI